MNPAGWLLCATAADREAWEELCALLDRGAVFAARGGFDLPGAAVGVAAQIAVPGLCKRALWCWPSAASRAA